jgi:anti-sigma-K factor RskA
MADQERENVAEFDDEALETLATACSTEPPAELRARVLAAVSREAQPADYRSRAELWRLLAFGATAAAATLALFVLGRGAPSADGSAVLVRELEGRLEQQDTDLRLLEDALQVHGEVVRILTAPTFHSAPLRSTDGSGGTARVLLDPATGAVALLGKGLPPPRAGRVYELWAIHGDGTPERAGTLSPPGERAFAVGLKVSDPSAVQRFAVSIEPEPGAEAPSSPFVLAGPVETR